jgi:hypothetical protein
MFKHAYKTGLEGMVSIFKWRMRAPWSEATAF